MSFRATSIDATSIDETSRVLSVNLARARPNPDTRDAVAIGIEAMTGLDRIPTSDSVFVGARGEGGRGNGDPRSARPPRCTAMRCSRSRAIAIAS